MALKHDRFEENSVEDYAQTRSVSHVAAHQLESRSGKLVTGWNHSWLLLQASANEMHVLTPWINYYECRLFDRCCLEVNTLIVGQQVPGMHSEIAYATLLKKISVHIPTDPFTCYRMHSLAQWPNRKQSYIKSREKDCAHCQFHYFYLTLDQCMSYTATDCPQ